ncbi:MAG: NAD-dependent epimerase/dehydratase family protein [Rhizobiales bacterium]|nr:NAD-dependent epimerase/dehydratase family protein [Hyphomicrobiales bacterium]NRB13020.1 NAD-dependent epimerase/dehydratase family protein [Hyphomicrobiales bacterium]
MDKIVVTGANGHVGITIVKQLVEAGYQVRATVRNKNDEFKTKRLSALGVEIVEADLLDSASLAKAFAGCDGLFQVAAGYKLASKDPERDIIRPAIEGAENTLRAAKQAGIKKVIFTSSVAAIGTTTGDKPLDETAWNDGAKETYTISKNRAERLAWKLADELDLNLVTILPCAIIGPNFMTHTPSTFLFQKIADGKLPIIPPIELSFVDVRDVAAAHILAYENADAKGRYIVSQGNYSFADIIAKIGKFAPKLKLPSVHAPRFIIPILPLFDWLEHKFTGSMRVMTRGILKEYMGDEKQLLSAQKAMNELGWKPRAVEITLADTLEWIQNNPVKNG